MVMVMRDHDSKEGEHVEETKHQIEIVALARGGHPLFGVEVPGPLEPTINHYSIRS